MTAFRWILPWMVFCRCIGGAEPADLFPDSPPLADGAIRIASWNVRHLNVAAGSEGYFAGIDRDEDLALLIAGFAKAVSDLQLDLVVLVEIQPRAGELSGLERLRRQLIARHGGEWQSLQTDLDYDHPDDPYGNLQFGLLWNARRGIVVDSAGSSVLHDLRQPRSPDGKLLRREQRAPWFIPVSVSSGKERLEFDLLALHLKSGGSTPQAAEVEAVTRFIARHQAAVPQRHLIVCGDWNIRPDENQQGRGRPRLRKLMGNSRSRTTSAPSLLRVLTVGDLGPSLDEWEELEASRGSAWLATFQRHLPYSHLDARPQVIDSLLDHMAISRSLDELFDHPVEVQLAGGKRDLRPGIEIPRPAVSDQEYLHFTDHLPVIVTLRVQGLASESRLPAIQIAGVLPNPIADEAWGEQVFLRNGADESIDLCGWRLRDGHGGEWKLDESDVRGAAGGLQRGRTIRISRRGRPMTLSNSGDMVVLLDAAGGFVDCRRYGEARTGELIWFE